MRQVSCYFLDIFKTQKHNNSSNNKLKYRRTCTPGEASQVRQAVMESLWGMCAADSLSMPVHWYYNIQDISKDFKGWIAGFHSPRERHPSSILTLSNTGTYIIMTHPTLSNTGISSLGTYTNLSTSLC